MFHRKTPDNPNRKTTRKKMRFSSLEKPERLVLVGFRCWQAGYETGDVNCWELAWNEYACALGPENAKCAISELGCWVRAVRKNACRNIKYFPAHCIGCTSDEACAISLIAACQYDNCRLAKARAFDLVANGYIDSVVKTATHYADTMTWIGQKLSTGSMQFGAGVEKSSNTSLRPNQLF